MTNKKKLSIEVNKILDKVLKNYVGLFTVKEVEGYEVYLNDIDETSGFYFAFIKETYDNKSHYINISWMPQSTCNKATSSTSFKIENFEITLLDWLENLRYYNQPSILDDNILKCYQDEFYNEYKILDDDADICPFSFDQQIRLLRFLDNVTKEIDQILDEKNKETIEEIKLKSRELKEILSTETKNGFMQKLGRIFAIARKAGFKTSNFIYKEFIKEFIKEGVKWVFNFAVKNHKLPEYINYLSENILKIHS